MRNFAKLAASAGMCLLAMTANSYAVTLDFTGYIDNVSGEKAVTQDFTNGTYLQGYTVAAHGSITSPNVVIADLSYASDPQAYFDLNQAGIGVCRSSGAPTAGQCNPTNDDNITGPSAPGGGPVETLSLSFVKGLTGGFIVTDIFVKNEGHIFTGMAGKLINVSLDGLSWASYAIDAAGKLLDGIPAATFSLASGQFIHFQFNNQQFYVSSMDISRDPGRIDIPLPAALPLLLGGLGGLGLLGRMRRRRQANEGVSA